MKFSEAIKEFSAWKGFSVKNNTVSGYTGDLRLLALYLRDPEITAISWGDIQQYQTDCIKLGWDSNTFVRKFIAYRKFFAYWHSKDPKVLDPEWIPVMYAEMKQPRVIDEANYKKLLGILSKDSKDPRHHRNRAMIQLLWDTGARNGELLSLNLDDIDLNKMCAVIRTEKAKFRRQYRQIFWTKETNESIGNWLSLREKLNSKYWLIKDKDALFISVTGVKAGTRLKVGGFAEMLRRYCEKAGIDHYNPHSFRHHMGHDIIKKGGSNSDVSNILGHSSLQSSFIYTMLNDKELEKRYRQFKGR
jgi:site-specific recombinase XerD